jgi:hypothetical protein
MNSETQESMPLHELAYRSTKTRYLAPLIHTLALMYKYPTQCARHRSLWRHRTHAWQSPVAAGALVEAANKLTVCYLTSHTVFKSCKLPRVDHPLHVLAPILCKTIFSHF